MHRSSDIALDRQEPDTGKPGGRKLDSDASGRLAAMQWEIGSQLPPTYEQNTCAATGCRRPSSVTLNFDYSRTIRAHLSHFSEAVRGAQQLRNFVGNGDEWLTRPRRCFKQ